MKELLKQEVIHTYSLLFTEIIALYAEDEVREKAATIKQQYFVDGVLPNNRAIEERYIKAMIEVYKAGKENYIVRQVLLEHVAQGGREKYGILFSDTYEPAVKNISRADARFKRRTTINGYIFRMPAILTCEKEMEEMLDMIKWRSSNKELQSRFEQAAEQLNDYYDFCSRSNGLVGTVKSLNKVVEKYENMISKVEGELDENFEQLSELLKAAKKPINAIIK